eukprot:GHVU01081206.1.p3 GENE.GHVU01081206.1~~GHVU01081206.1.p3  ORF type:complete len:146 (+),score=20.13 GHVU01081206.1:432-869(+)
MLNSCGGWASRWSRRLQRRRRTCSCDPRATPKHSTVGAEDESYFDNYSRMDIHREMLLGVHRTATYRDFIFANKHLFKDKTVLGAGCGSGILSFFCAQAGGKLVIRVCHARAYVCACLCVCMLVRMYVHMRVRTCVHACVCDLII